MKGPVSESKALLSVLDSSVSCCTCILSEFGGVWMELGTGHPRLSPRHPGLVACSCPKPHPVTHFQGASVWVLHFQGM